MIKPIGALQRQMQIWQITAHLLPSEAIPQRLTDLEDLLELGTG